MLRDLSRLYLGHLRKRGDSHSRNTETRQNKLDMPSFGLGIRYLGILFICHTITIIT